MKFKFILSLFIALLSFFSVAQQVNNTEFKTKTLQVYQNLDKNRVPHGILLDFGMEFTNLLAFNGTLTDSTYTTTQKLSDIYKTLLMCRVRSNVTTGFITPQEYTTRWYSQRAKGVITLSGQYFKYNRFANNAYPNKLNYSNNKFSDKFVGTVWQNPYEEKQLFAMTASLEKYKGLSFQVKLPSNLFLSNYPSLVQNIQVDFSDGLGYRLVTQNQLINVNYNVANTYTWKYKISLTNGQTMFSHSKIIVENGLNAIEIANPCTSCPLQSSQATQAIVQPPASNLTQYYKKTITATNLTNGLFFSSATIYVRYASGTTISKPLIVAEGFDPGIILSPEQEAGDNNINDFLNGIDNSNSLLEDEITTYDVIYVDWNNGVDFLQRNALVLEEVIKWVNLNKSGSQQNVVLGQSMGGLIARYALKDMENKNLNHDTRLYVSHDAPHLGSNTPYSVQYSARHLRNVYVSTPIPLIAGEILLPLISSFADGIISLINNNTNWTYNGQPLQEVDYITPLTAFSLADTPASRQMNYNWINRKYELKNFIHDAWQLELSNLGYPAGYPALGKPIRNISIANGSECGVLQPNNGNIMSYVKDAGRDTFLSNYIGILDAVYGALITNPVVVVVALFPGSSYWEIDFQSKYMTTLNENKNIYHGSIKYKKKVFWLIPVSITITNENKNQVSGLLPYDIYGGGNQITPTSSLPLSGITSNSFGFIPTASALDIGKYTTPINDIDYRRPYVGGQAPIAPKNSPFQNFVTGFIPNNPNLSNSRHISFNVRNGNWLRSELNTGITDIITNCAYVCSNSQINGSYNLCTTSTYTLPISDSSVTWSVTPANTVNIISGQGTNQVTLSNIGNNQAFTLNAVVTSDACGINTLSRSLRSGRPETPLSISGPSVVATGALVNYFAGPSAGADEYLWWLPYPYDTVDIFDYFGTNWAKTNTSNESSVQVFTGTSQNTGLVQVMGKNICGCGGARNISVTHGAGGSGIYPRLSNPLNNNLFKIYPNPSSTIVNIDLKNQQNKPIKSAVIKAELYNMMGEVKRNVSINNNIASIDVSGLLRGIYLLKINIDGTIESHQIAVE